jgi:hypothetical protein
VRIVENLERLAETKAASRIWLRRDLYGRLVEELRADALGAWGLEHARLVYPLRFGGIIVMPRPEP